MTKYINPKLKKKGLIETVPIYVHWYIIHTKYVSVTLFLTTHVYAIFISKTKYKKLYNILSMSFLSNSIYPTCFIINIVYWYYNSSVGTCINTFYFPGYFIVLRKKYVIGNFSKKLVSEKSCPNFELLFFNVAQTR